jgi:hypothetical protein
MKTGANGEFDLIDLAEVFIDFITNTPPTVSVTAPTGTITTTQRPAIEFTYNDDDRDVMDAYQLKLFTAAEYGAGGFDPETSTPLWGSGITYTRLTIGTGLTTLLPKRMYLDNGVTFRVYAKVRQTVDSYWSDWEYSEFDIAVTQPAAPTFSATAEDSNWRVRLDITGNVDNSDLYIERSDDGGTTFTLVRGAFVTDVDNAEVVVLYDYEAPPGVVVTYRAYVVVSDVISAIVTDTATSLPTVATGWIVKDLFNPTDNLAVDVFSASWVTQQDEEQATYHPLGRRFPVTVSDVVHGKDGTLELELSVDDAGSFEVIRNRQQPVLLQRVYADVAEQKYARLGKTLRRTENNTDPVVVDLDIPFVEVDMPSTEPV